MENFITTDVPGVLKMILSTFLIFSIMLVITRISGLRTFAKMSSLDFASTIAVGSILASVIMSSGASLVKGGIALVFIIMFQFLFSYFTRTSTLFNKVAANSPLLLMKDGEILQENLKKSNISRSDLIAKLREANVIQFSEVYAVIFETTGDVSVLHGKDPKDLDDRLLEGVRT
ncbi:DUF421 domain-containing protein [Croceiramulus getboli]|nr:DUF421 domain-containing protein [Flavobacteriaceae bacterium YJPT1-3]